MDFLEILKLNSKGGLVMNQMTILLIKFITSLVAFSIGLDLFFDATIVDIVSFSFLVTVVSYAIGDRIVLPRVGRTNALVTDFFLTYTMVWIFGSVILENYIQIGWGSLLSAFLITGGEYFVHRSLLKDNEETYTQKAFNPKMSYVMEMSEEQNPRIKR